MGKTYFREDAMVKGGPFRCHNCHKKLAINLVGSKYQVEFVCPRCKTYIIVKCNESIPFAEKILSEADPSKGSAQTKVAVRTG